MMPLFAKLRQQRAWLLLGLWALLLLWPEAAWTASPDSDPWEISANRLTRFERLGTVVAEGEVVLTELEPAGPQPMVIEADWMRYDADLGTIRARGNIRLRTATEVVEATEARLDLDRQTGVLKQATIFLPREEYNLYISGEEMEKTGPLTYEVADGTITSCPPENGSRPWHITSERVRIKKGGMAVLRNATLRVKQAPVLYTPFFAFPAKSARESGFLLPEASSSERQGSGLILPYFLDLSPSHDLTLYPGYMAERGWIAGLEARYVAGPRSRGTFIFSHLRDRLVDTEEDIYKDDGLLRTERNRYWLRGKADHYFSDTLVGRLDLDLVSDQDYLEEFRDGTMGFDTSNRQFFKVFNRSLQEETIDLRHSTLQLIQSFNSSLLLAELQTVQDPTDRSSWNQTQTLPRVQFNGRMPIRRMPMSLAWDTEYVHYWRENNISYHRLDLHPQLIRSIPRGLLEGRITAGARETLWEVTTHGAPGSIWPRSRFQNRFVPDFEADIATTLARDFAVDLGELETLNHAIRPRLIYSYLPSVDQKTLPSLDAEDRIEPKNWLTYEWGNHFKASGRREEGDAYERYLGYFTLSQTYNIREERRTLANSDERRRPFSDVLLETAVYPLDGLQLKYETTVSVYGKGVTSYQFLTGYQNSLGDLLSIDYSYRQNPAVSAPFFFTEARAESERKLTLALRLALSETISIQGDLTQYWDVEETVDETVRVVYQPSCWSVEFMASKTPGDRRFAVIFSLTGIGNLLGLGLLEDSYFQYEVF